MKMDLVDPVDWSSITEQIDIEFGAGVTKKLLGNHVPVTMAKGTAKIFYAIPTDWMKRLSDISENLDIQFIGKELGSIDKGKFRLSLHVLDEIIEATESFIIVSRQGAEAFTYGRSIIKESVLQLNKSLVRGQRVIVLNENRECLGIAVLSVDASKLTRLAADRLVAKNLVDIGWFIRRLG
jgi:ribosome biogenesis protein Nip4